MGAFKYTITVEADSPPHILLGQNLGGAIVTKLEQEKQELVSASDLAKTYNLSATTIRDRLFAINQGTGGKHMYNPVLAHQMLKKDSENKRGRKRAN